MRFRLTIFAALLATLGCGKEGPNTRQALKGTVTLAGEALDEGSIQFVPIESGSAWRAGAMIVDGKYAIPREKGLPPGSYRVMISSGVVPETEPLTPEQLRERLPKPPSPEELKKLADDKDKGKDKAKDKDKGKAVKTTPTDNTQERVPAEFNSATRLKVEVRADAENVFDFSIP
jgi:hypothetical protein